MHKTTTALATGALGLGLASFASAQSAPEIYAGGFFDIANADIDYSDCCSNRDIDGKHKQLGALLGARFGIGDWVLGGEVDHSRAISNGQYRFASNANACTADSDNLCRINDVTRLKLLIGHNLGNLFLFGTLGANWTNATISQLNAAIPVDVSEQGHSFSIGLETALNEASSSNARLRLEIIRDYVDFPGVDDPVNYNNAMSSTTLRAGAIFTF